MRAGDVVWNPLTGEKALLIESGEETAGARIIADFAVERGGFVPGGEHVHDVCAEHFDVQEGRITFVVDGEEQTLGPGEQVTVLPGSWHRWWNAGEGEVKLRTRIEPALRFEEAIAVFWGLCADGHTNAEGTPSPLYGAAGDALQGRAPLSQAPAARPTNPAPAAGRRRAAARPGAGGRALPRPRHASVGGSRPRAPARGRDVAKALNRALAFGRFGPARR